MTDSADDLDFVQQQQHADPPVPYFDDSQYIATEDDDEVGSIEQEYKLNERSLEEQTKTLVIDSGEEDEHIAAQTENSGAEQSVNNTLRLDDNEPMKPGSISEDHNQYHVADNSLQELYDLQELLGNGAFSKVYAARHKFAGTDVAVKIVSFTSFKPGDLARQLNILNNEVAILRKVTLELPLEQNLIRLLDVVKEDHQIAIVMEVLRGKELFDRIVERVNYSERDAVNLMHQIVNGVNALHSIGILHRDLKPENLVFKDDAKDSMVKITDFGLAQVVGWSDVHRAVVGTPGYVAPEVLSSKVYSPACDIWSLGVILYILLVGYPPFYAEKNSELFELIKKGKFYFYEQEWKHISTEAKDLVTRMLTVDPRARITCAEILSHPWMTHQQSASPLATAAGNLGNFNARRKFKAALAAVKIGTQLKTRRKLLSLVQSTPASVFSLEELVIIRKAFLSSATDNVLERPEQLEKVLKSLGFNKTPKDRMFDVFDINQDGTVQYSEFLGYLSTLKRSGEAALRLCFELYDFDNSGFVSRSEVTRVLDDITDLSITERNQVAEDIFRSVELNPGEEMDFAKFTQVVFPHPVLVEAFLAPLHLLNPENSTDD